MTCIFFQVIWKRLYNCSSKKDVGTLYQLRCLINRRNVVSKPEKSVTAEAHICTLAMKLFGLENFEDSPTSTTFPTDYSETAPNERWKTMQLAIT